MTKIVRQTPEDRAKAKIAARMVDMPANHRRTYMAAVSGRSRKAGVIAMCQMCFGNENVVESIRACPDPSCPIYQYRPYQE